ncbi:MAG: GTP cyclohydrolase II [Acidobacteriota bacterium]|nr:GTP cyclohydrolase II [Acidobacteriota bacterium]
MPDTTRQLSNAKLPTKWGEFRALGFERRVGEKVETAVALVMGDLSQGTPLVRIHSECLTGDVFGSQRCDCGEQFETAMQAIADEGSGLLIYERQEGRGIGLMAKLQAYELQDQGMDTVEANQHLGYAVDARDYVLPAEILLALNVCRVRLMTNNPKKVEAVEKAGVKVEERMACEVKPGKHDIFYLKTKKQKMGHHLTLV